MRAAFDISLETPKKLTPSSSVFIAIAELNRCRDRRIVIGAGPGVLFIGEDGFCSQSDAAWLKDNCTIIEFPEELNITFRNK